LDKKDGGFVVTKSALKTEARVPGIDKKVFEELAEKAKVNCPVSRTLAALEITLETHLNT
jgi:lipoyl-dependent peroxiredoxin